MNNNNNNNNNNLIIKEIAIKSYYNPYKDRRQIYKENKNKSGIYCWNNLINGKFYIGSSENLTGRLYRYLSSRCIAKESLKYNSNIYKALLKYDYYNFSFNILKYCDIDELIKWEQYYINLLNPQYNILKIAGSTRGHKHSLTTLLKLRSYKPSSETLTKLRRSKELSGHTTIIINKKDNTIKTYSSLRAAARSLNVTHQGLIYCIKNNILLKNTYLIISEFK